MQLKRLVYFLFINILVSAITTLTVLAIWDRTHQTEKTEMAVPSPAVVIPTVTQAQVTLVETEAAPQITMQAYQVSAGETLGEIAFAFDLTVEELLEMNGLTDPDSIGAGTTIFVPVADNVDSEGDPEVDVEMMNGDAQGVLTPESGVVEIVAVIGAGDLDSERVQLRGLSDEALSLSGWRLQDDRGNAYIFPQITLFGGGAIDVYSTSGVDTVVALYWNSGEAIWQPGEGVTLFDDAGNIQATYTVP